MTKLSCLILIFLCVSCSKTTYSIKQAVAHISLELRGRDNEDVLKDPKIPEEQKHKIRIIQNYKKFFYDYFKMKKTQIYEETTMLDSEAVSYLVIASPVGKVEAVKHKIPFDCFAFVGTFPYLGFSDKDDATEFQSELSKEYFTYLRPVYAYSTLNQLFFDDNILSSFFKYEDYDLAELIFHELTHTVFFVKADVDFNESLAQYFGKELAFEYFNVAEEKRKARQLEAKQDEKLLEIVSKFVNEYNEKLQKQEITNKDDALKIMKKVFKEKYKDMYANQCKEFNKVHCNWKIDNWNNARMAEFLTYQSKQSLVKQLREKKGMNLKELMTFLIDSHKKYKKSDYDSFTEYLKKEEKL